MRILRVVDIVLLKCLHTPAHDALRTKKSCASNMYPLDNEPLNLLIPNP